MHGPRTVLAAALLAALGCLAPGCDDETEAPAEPVCGSGARWELGAANSPDMSPGGACLACHVSNGGPPLAAAGTVFAAPHEADDCYGVAGLTVEIEDADQVVHTVETGPTGNFYLEGDPAMLALPIIARVIRGDDIRLMPRYVHATDCNACHTVNGAQSAPGRILSP
jgi:hypothetical protein